MIGPSEVAIVAGIALLIFGPSQLPKLARSAGQSIREFRNVKRELQDGLDAVDDVTTGVTQDAREVARDVNRATR